MGISYNRQDMEQELVRRSQRGDLEAFNALVRQYQTPVYNLCLRMLGERGAAEDATQEAFIAAFQKLGQLRGESFKAWLFRIAANKCTDILRRSRARPLSLEAIEADPAAPREGPEATALRRETRRLVQEGLASLPPEQRLALLLIDVQGFSYEEAAQVLGASLGTVKSRLHRGREQLRDFLRQRELLG